MTDEVDDVEAAEDTYWDAIGKKIVDLDKYGRRNRVLIYIICGLGLCMVVGYVILGFVAVQARTASDEAKEASAKATLSQKDVAHIQDIIDAGRLSSCLNYNDQQRTARIAEKAEVRILAETLDPNPSPEEIETVINPFYERYDDTVENSHRDLDCSPEAIRRRFPAEPKP